MIWEPDNSLIIGLLIKYTLCTMKLKLMCILMSNSLLEQAVLFVFGYGGKGACYTGPQLDSVVTQLRQFPRRVTKIKLQSQGSNIMFDHFEWLISLWFPSAMLPVSMMIQRCSREQLAEITGNELLAVCCDMRFSNADEFSSPSPCPALLTSAWGKLWTGPGMWTVQLGKAVMRTGRSQLGKASVAENKLFSSLKLAGTLPPCFAAYCLWLSEVSDHGGHSSETYLILPEESGRRLTHWKIPIIPDDRDFCCLVSQCSYIVLCRKSISIINWYRML